MGCETYERDSKLSPCTISLLIKQILNLYRENIVCKCEKLTDSDSDEEEKQNMAPDISSPSDSKIKRKNSEPTNGVETMIINPKKSVPSNILDIKASLMADGGDQGHVPEERKDSVRSFIEAVNLSNISDKDELKHLRDCKKKLK